MKSKFLFPHKWRIAGIIIAALSFGALYLIDHGLQNKFFLDYSDTISNGGYILMIVGLMLIGFSKEKIEDEQIAQLRLDSLQWAIYINYAILIVCIIFITGLSILSVIVLNVISPIVFFIIRFRWKIYLINRLLKKEEKLA